MLMHNLNLLHVVAIESNHDRSPPASTYSVRREYPSCSIPLPGLVRGGIITGVKLRRRAR